MVFFRQPFLHPVIRIRFVLWPPFIWERLMTFLEFVFSSLQDAVSPRTHWRRGSISP